VVGGGEGTTANGRCGTSGGGWEGEEGGVGGKWRELPMRGRREGTVAFLFFFSSFLLLLRRSPADSVYKFLGAGFVFDDAGSTSCVTACSAALKACQIESFLWVLPLRTSRERQDRIDRGCL